MTNYEILKEYEAHNTPVPTYEELQRLKGVLKECKEFISERLDRLHGGKKYGILSMINEVLK